MLEDTILSDNWGAQKVVENAVDKVFEIAVRQVNPYQYLYNNPTAIKTPQYFAHWAQRYTAHKAYMVLAKAAEITGYEAVPSELLHKHVARDGWKGRGIRVGSLVFYLIKLDEMPAGLRQRYEVYKKLLDRDLKNLPAAELNGR